MDEKFNNKKVGIFTGKASGYLLNKSLLYNEAEHLFFVEGEKESFNETLVNTLNQQDAIFWIKEALPAKIAYYLSTPIKNDPLFVDSYNQKNKIDVSSKNVKTVSQDDYKMALDHPNESWSSYIIGLYLIKNNKREEALPYLKNYFAENPLGYEAYMPLTVAMGKNGFMRNYNIPEELPKDIVKETIQNKYIADFLQYNFVKDGRKITKLDLINFILTLITTTIFFGTFLYAFIKSF